LYRIVLVNDHFPDVFGLTTGQMLLLAKPVGSKELKEMQITD